MYGAGLAKSWALHANKIGIEVVSPNKTSEGFDAKATDYSALAQKIKATGADTIYIGSITGQNTGKLWKDLRAALPDITIMSGDGVFEESWYKGAGTSGNGTWLTFGGVGPAQLTGAGKDWYDKYKTDHAGKDPAIYTSYGNAAANVALAALQKAGTNDRYEVLKNVMATKDLADRARDHELRRQRRRHRRRDQWLQGRDQLAACLPADPVRQGVIDSSTLAFLNGGGPPRPAPFDIPVPFPSPSRRPRPTVRMSPAMRGIIAFALFQVFGIVVFGAEQFFQTEVIGVSNGLIFALVALGYTLVYGIIELINFAHGDVFMLGSMLAFLLIGPIFAVTGDTPVLLKIGIILLVLGVTMIGTAALNVAIERVAYKPLRNAPKLAPLISAIGMSFVLQNVGLLLGRPRQQEHRQHLRDRPTSCRCSGSTASRSTSSRSSWRS